MEEQGKHAILFAATRMLIEMIDSDQLNFGQQYLVDKAIQEAEFVLERPSARV